MNKSAAIFLLDDSVTSVEVRIPNTARTFTYKSMNIDLEENDSVVVQFGSFEFIVGTVVSVGESEIEYNGGSDINYKWIVAKVDFDTYNELNLAEEDVVKQIQKLELESRKEQLKAALLGTVGADALSQIEFNPSK